MSVHAQVFLYVSHTKQVVGCLVAEAISSANPVVSHGVEEVTFCPRPLDDLLGQSTFPHLLKCYHGVLHCLSSHLGFYLTSCWLVQERTESFRQPCLGAAPCSAKVPPLVELGDRAGELASPGLAPSARLTNNAAMPPIGILSEAACKQSTDPESSLAVTGSEPCTTCVESPLLHRGRGSTFTVHEASNVSQQPAAHQERAEHGVEGATSPNPQAESKHLLAGPPKLKDTPLTRWLKQSTGRSRSTSSSAPAESHTPAEEQGCSLMIPGDRCSVEQTAAPASGGGSWLPDKPQLQPAPQSQAAPPRLPCGGPEQSSQQAAESSQVQDTRVLHTEVGTFVKKRARKAYVEDHFQAGGGQNVGEPGGLGPIVRHSHAVAQAEEGRGQPPAPSMPDPGGAREVTIPASTWQSEQENGSRMDSRCPDAGPQFAPAMQRASLPNRSARPGSCKGGRGVEEMEGALLVSHELREAHLGVRLVWVAKESQRKGVARKLLDAAR
jgi:ESCO1/2 acetyl-transferase